MEKSGVREWVVELKASLLGDMPTVTAPLVMKAAECAIRFIAAFLLANAQVFSSWRPFALALAAASGTGAEGLFALLGASSGFVLLGGLTDGIKHLSIAFLIASVGFVLKDLAFAKSRVFPPLLAGSMTGIISFVFLLDRGISLFGLVMFLGEAGAVAGCTYLFRAALEGGTELARRLGLFLMGAGLVAALTPMELFGFVSLGRLAAGAGALVGAMGGGWALGGALGVALGAAVDLQGGEAPFFALAFGLCGLVSGLLRGKGRVAGPLAYLITMGTCLLWQAGEAPVAALPEAFALAGIFLLLPVERLCRMGGERGQESKTGAIRLAARRLGDTAAVFSELFEAVTAAMKNDGGDSCTLASAFDRTAERVCKRCVMNHVCWNRDGEATRSAINDATPKFLQRGSAEAGDFPTWFSSKCKNMPKFVSVLNEELVALDYRRRYEKRAREDRELVASQYGELSKMLSRAAQRAAGEPGEDVRLRRKVERYLKTVDAQGGCMVYRDGYGRLNVELEGMDGQEAEKLQDGLSAVAATALGEPRQVAGGVIFTQKERYRAKVGVASRCRRDETHCGDYGTWFKDGEGRLFVILSDGRGTGREAMEESQSAVRVLEKLLRAGAEPESAVRTLDSAYTLRGGGGGYATVDLFAIDLFSGSTTVIKWGAAPSYLKTRRGVSRMGEPTPPPGTGCGYEKLELALEEGDFIILCSDGLADRGDDAWVLRLIESYDQQSPRELAAQLTAVAEQTRGARDDITVMALKIELCQQGATLC